MAICQDVLQRIGADLIMPMTFSFWENRYDLRETVGAITPQNCVNENKCNVCAKGSIFMSWLGNFNNLDWLEVMDVEEQFETMPKELAEIFGKELMDAIECAFELQVYPWCESNETNRKAARLFDHLDSRERLIAIMNNIIENDGEFVF